MCTYRCYCAVRVAYRVPGTTPNLNLIIIGLWPSNCCLSTFFFSSYLWLSVNLCEEKEWNLWGKNNKSILRTCFFAKEDSSNMYKMRLNNKNNNNRKNICCCCFFFFGDFLRNAIIVPIPVFFRLYRQTLVLDLEKWIPWDRAKCGYLSPYTSYAEKRTIPQKENVHMSN